MDRGGFGVPLRKSGLEGSRVLPRVDDTERAVIRKNGGKTQNHGFFGQARKRITGLKGSFLGRGKIIFKDPGSDEP